jgi:hypothetical protein
VDSVQYSGLSPKDAALDVESHSRNCETGCGWKSACERQVVGNEYVRVSGGTEIHD